MSKEHLRVRRIQNELKSILNDPPEDWSIIQRDSNYWKCQINCQAHCPYQGKPFHMIVTFGKNYPYKSNQFALQKPAQFKIAPQDVKRIYHPNISPQGNICNQIINEQNPATTIRDRMQTFMNFLIIPNPNSPLNGQAAILYKKDILQFNRKAKLLFYQSPQNLKPSIQNQIQTSYCQIY